MSGQDPCSAPEIVASLGNLVTSWLQQTLSTWERPSTRPSFPLHDVGSAVQGLEGVQFTSTGGVGDAASAGELIWSGGSMCGCHRARQFSDTLSSLHEAIRQGVS